MTEENKIPTLAESSGMIPTGHKNKKGEDIYYSSRSDKTGQLKKSFFTIRDGPRKVYISRQSLLKNNSSFLNPT